MNPIELKGKKYTNWKDYLLDKFSDKVLFKVDQFDFDNKSLESYRITSKSRENKTEIIFQMMIDKNKYVEIFNVYFNNPGSPQLENDNRSNDFGFDGQGSTFNEKNLKEVDDWIEIPISKGWTETTTYFDGNEIKTECTWTQGNKSGTIPIEQKYLTNYSCLALPIIPLKIFLTHRKLKKNSDKVKIIENVIKPMVDIQVPTNISSL